MFGGNSCPLGAGIVARGGRDVPTSCLEKTYLARKLVMEDLAIAPLDAAARPSALTDPPSTAGAQAPAPAILRSPDQAERFVLELIAAHADSLLRTARRYSMCVDDAQDAYQRGLEILMRHARRLDAERAGGWLHTVVKHEALAINKARSRIVGGEEADLDAMEVRTAPSPEDHVLAFEQVARSAEALQRLKPQEVRALWLKAMGNSYQEICEATGWTYTKVNRCLAEGRKSFLARYAGIEAGEECRRWAPVISAMVDGEATAEQLVAVRPHLRNCGACKAAVRELHASNASLAALFPVGVLAAGDGGGGLLAGAGDLMSRLWDALWGDLGDRAASLALRAQAVVPTVAPGRGMAIAASVAALAGGGVALEKPDRQPPAPHVAVSAPATAPATDRVKLARVAPAAGAPAAATSRTPADRPARLKRTRARRAPKRHVHARRRTVTLRPSHTTARTAVAPRVAAAPTPPAPPPPPATTVTARPPTRPVAARSAPVAPARGNGGGAASGEFSIESG
jgi:RNA polymerase sigma factor (sigma-70 family)